MCRTHCAEKYCLFSVFFTVIRRLNAKKIFARSNLRRLAMKRIKYMLTKVGKDLFPLIEAAEIDIDGIRPIKTEQGLDYFKPERFATEEMVKVTELLYEVHGIADVISEFSFSVTDSNIIIKLVSNYFQELFENVEGFRSKFEQTQVEGIKHEIIIDYKGSSRPGKKPGTERGDEHEWQIRTYTWLREESIQNTKIIAGIILYINELYPSEKDIKRIIKLSEDTHDNIENVETTNFPLDQEWIDILKPEYRTKADPTQFYLDTVDNDFILKRAFRIIETVDNDKNEISLTTFDKVVIEIESCKETEAKFGNIGIWKPKGDRGTCKLCDKHYYCPKSTKYSIKQFPSVP